MMPIIAVVSDTLEAGGYRWHAAKHSYLAAAFDVARVMPLLVPAFGNDVNVRELLARVDGVMLTGSKTNVHPKHYGQAPSAEHEPFDEARDDTSLPIIRAAIDLGVPLFAICRGIQEMNVALGGSLASEIQEQPGVDDHREPDVEALDARYALRHAVKLMDDGSLGWVLGSTDVAVNSLHRQAIDQPADVLRVEAKAPDGTVEAVSVRDAKGFAVGVQWHPEFWATTDPPSRKLFEAFGDAVRAHAAGKAEPKTF
ncbi:MAG: gamma-glutamyl-gamma-aminobutyrate hydrolase family protein [Pseudomonadota bacterium]